MKTIGVEIERRQTAMAWVSVPSHWDHDRVTREVAARIESIRLAADTHPFPLEWSMTFGPVYRLCAVIGAHSHSDFEPDYCFNDEAPPAHPDQIAMEL